MGEEAHPQPNLQTTDSSTSGSWPTVAVKRSLGMFPVRNVDGSRWDEHMITRQALTTSGLRRFELELREGDDVTGQGHPTCPPPLGASSGWPESMARW